jgi:hypothetical protein
MCDEFGEDVGIEHEVKRVRLLSRLLDLVRGRRMWTEVCNRCCHDDNFGIGAGSMYCDTHLLRCIDAHDPDTERIEEVHIGGHHSYIGASGSSSAGEGPTLATTGAIAEIAHWVKRLASAARRDHDLATGEISAPTHREGGQHHISELLRFGETPSPRV